MVEADHSHRNVAIYDNRCHNCMTAVSFDPAYGGPVLYARNYAINVSRDKTVKVGAVNKTSGYFIYNNTTLSTQTTPNNWQLYQTPDAGQQDGFGFRNNVFVHRNLGQYSLVFDAAGYSTVDFTHNSFYPNNDFYWEGTNFGHLASAQANIGPTTPIFSGAKRHANDNITVSNPWTTTITLGATYATEVTATYVPVISAGDAAKNSGVAIPNITDGFSGPAPDRGAIIEGRPVPQYGDRTQ
jgi:hypothetical protein